MSEQHPSPTQSIPDLLRNILAQEDHDSATVIAGALNLYLDSIRRRGARHILIADDIFRILSIVNTLFAASEVEQGIREVTGGPRRRVP